MPVGAGQGPVQREKINKKQQPPLQQKPVNAVNRIPSATLKKQPLNSQANARHPTWTAVTARSERKAGRGEENQFQFTKLL